MPAIDHDIADLLAPFAHVLRTAGGRAFFASDAHRSADHETVLFEIPLAERPAVLVTEDGRPGMVVGTGWAVRVAAVAEYLGPTRRLPVLGGDVPAHEFAVFAAFVRAHGGALLAHDHGRVLRALGIGVVEPWWGVQDQIGLLASIGATGDGVWVIGPGMREAVRAEAGLERTLRTLQGYGLPPPSHQGCGGLRVLAQWIVSGPRRPETPAPSTTVEDCVRVLREVLDGVRETRDTSRVDDEDGDGTGDDLPRDRTVVVPVSMIDEFARRITHEAVAVARGLGYLQSAREALALLTAPPVRRGWSWVMRANVPRPFLGTIVEWRREVVAWP